MVILGCWHAPLTIVQACNSTSGKVSTQAAINQQSNNPASAGHAGADKESGSTAVCVVTRWKRSSLPLHREPKRTGSEPLRSVNVGKRAVVMQLAPRAAVSAEVYFGPGWLLRKSTMSRTLPVGFFQIVRYVSFVAAIPGF